MKKLICLSLLLIVLLPCLAYAQDIDGIWWDPAYGSGEVFMIRENGGTVIVAALNLAHYGTSVGFDALVGFESGNTIYLVSSDFSTVDEIVTVTLTSDTTGIVTIDSCAPFNPAYDCVFPAGTSFTVEKIF